MIGRDFGVSVKFFETGRQLLKRLDFSKTALA